VIGTPLLLGPDEQAALAALREKAAAHPVDMPPLLKRLQTADGKGSYLKWMLDELTIELPVAYAVSFSIETNHPGGRSARHLSMSVSRPGRTPIPEAVWMVAQELGFAGSIEQGVVWLEDLADDRAAVNLLQLMGVSAKEGHA